MKWPDEAAPRFRLTLDWDTEADKEEALPLVRGEQAEMGQQTLSEFRESGDVWELWESANHGVNVPHEEGTGEGIHYIEWDAAESIGDVAALRRRFLDDQLRYRRDRTRWQHGSPYYQVLYGLKGLSPGSRPPYAAEARAERVETHGFADADTKDPETRRVDWARLTSLAAEHAGGQAALGRLFAERSRSGSFASGEPRKAVYNWVHGRNEPSELHKQQLRRYARKHDLGHYQEGEAVPSEPPFDTVQRRSITEGINIPWFGDDRDDEEDEGSPSRNIMVRTGFFGAEDEAAEGERTPDDTVLRQYHDEVMAHVIDLFEPASFSQGDEQQSLSRAPNGVNIEAKPLHEEEAVAYLENAARYAAKHGSELPAALIGQHIVVHIILWNEEFTEPLWVYLGLCHGGYTDDHHELPQGMRTLVDRVDPSLGGGRRSSWWNA